VSTTTLGTSPLAHPRAGRTCAATTAKGEPCRNWAGGNGLCSWHDPERTRKPAPPRISRTGSRVCVGCGHELPARKFGTRGKNPKTGEPYRRGTCLDCEAKERRAKGIPERHPRYDARGFVWCNNCRQYLPGHRFARHPYDAEKYWSYCRECTRWIDRHRARSIPGTAEHTKATADRLKRQRRQDRKEQKERRTFVADTILLLGRRGFTRAEICRLCDVSFTSLIAWTRAERKITRNVELRFGELLRLTQALPLAVEPVRRRRLPHPEMPRLLAAMQPVIERYPVRSRWKTA